MNDAAPPFSPQSSKSTTLAATRRFRLEQLPFFYWGAWCVCLGLSVYALAIALSITRLVLIQGNLFVDTIARLLWMSGFPTTIGTSLIAIDLALMLPAKRRGARRTTTDLGMPPAVTAVLTAYNDEKSIGAAVRDFVGHPLVRRVIVVDNNSSDQTAERAREAGAIVHIETTPGYGSCVYRCLSEGLKFEDTNLVALCEGDMTFRADDLDKFVAYQRHAEIVNGTRIVEQLRDFDTQLSTFMYYGNFVVGKMLEVKHLGKGTFTDVGTTYKVIRRDCLAGLLRHMDPTVNLEFNAHFLDRALEHGYTMIECPITFHPRVGVSKGGNVNNLRAMKVGLRMIFGLSFGWRKAIFH